MGESLRVTIVCEPGEDGPIAASPEVLPPHGQGRTPEEAPGQHDRRKAGATHSA